ncbi:MAG: amidohydrolase family protein [Cyclobacteriaceae bacterium]
MKKLIYSIILLLAVVSVYAQVPVPAGPQSGPIMITGVTAHIGDGSVIENAAIGFDKGKITFVGQTSAANTDGHEVIDASGKHVYPGFIAPNIQLGLEEIGAIRSMRDFSEVGGFNPNVRSLIAYNTDSEFIPTLRFNGVLLAESAPSGGRISGTSSVMEMEGWNWEDAAHTTDMGIHLNWPRRMRRNFDYATYTVKLEPNKNYNKQVTELGVHFDDAVAYGKESSKVPNLKLEAMQGLLDGSQTLFIHTSDAKEIIESVRFAKGKGVKNVVIVTGDPALQVAEFLKDNSVGVIVSSTHRLPSRPGVDVYGPYKLPALLAEAGVTIAMTGSDAMSARNLPFAAGTAVAYGMDKEEALKMITSNAAELLGIADRVGSIKVGKDATIFVSEGDALDYRTNNLTHAFISGKQVILDNKQQELFDRYSRKYGHND